MVPWGLNQHKMFKETQVSDSTEAGCHSSQRSLKRRASMQQGQNESLTAIVNLISARTSKWQGTHEFL